MWFGMLIIGGINNKLIALTFVAGLAYVLTFIDGVAPISKFQTTFQSPADVSSATDAFWNGMYVMLQQVNWWGCSSLGGFHLCCPEAKVLGGSAWYFRRHYVHSGWISAGYLQRDGSGAFFPCFCLRRSSARCCSSSSCCRARSGSLPGSRIYEYKSVTDVRQHWSLFMDALAKRFDYLFRSTRGLNFSGAGGGGDYNGRFWHVVRTDGGVGRQRHHRQSAQLTIGRGGTGRAHHHALPHHRHDHRSHRGVLHDRDTAHEAPRADHHQWHDHSGVLNGRYFRPALRLLGA
jgi:hypothetical protein